MSKYEEERDRIKKKWVKKKISLTNHPVTLALLYAFYTNINNHKYF